MVVRYNFFILILLSTLLKAEENTCSLVETYAHRILSNRMVNESFDEQHQKLLDVINQKQKSTDKYTMDFFQKSAESVLSAAYQVKIYPRSERMKNLDVLITFSEEQKRICERKYAQFEAENEQRIRAEVQARQKPKLIMVNAQCTAGLGYCLAEDLTLSPPSGAWASDVAGASVNVTPNGGSVAGSYQYTIRLDLGNKKRSCSGSFTIDGSKPNVTIDVFQDCRLNYVNAF